MQLIVNTDIDTDLPIKMSTIEQKSLDQKFDHAALLENLINDYEGVKDNIKCEEKPEECNDNQNDNSNSDIVDDKEVLSEGEDISKDVSNKEEAEQNKDTSNDNEYQITEDLEEAKEEETIESVEVENEKEANEHNNVCESVNIEQMQSTKDNDKTDSELTTFDQDCDNDVAECDNEVSEEITNDKSIDETSPISTEMEEVINIPDEKDEECVNNILDEQMDIVQETDLIDYDDKKNNQQDISNKQNSQEPNKKSDDVILSEYNSLVKNDQISVVPEKRLSTENCTEEKKKLTHICKLSNTLDILSDEDEEPPKQEEVKESQKEPVVDKQCISIEDDDDIMLIDEESLKSSCKESKTNDSLSDSKEEDANKICKEYITKDTDKEKNGVEQMCVPTNKKENSPETVDETVETEMNGSESEEGKGFLTKPKPLLKPTKFLKIPSSIKKNLTDMTREELEEFCLMKIVEGVVDRSNLSEIKIQLKTMAQNLEEYKKKALMITKQNRDLQVVLKSVQEEQKKHSDTSVTPLKITRSVGMQVLMTDKCGGKKKPVLGVHNVYSNNKQNKPSPTNSKKNQQIPVPRLVPAVINNVNNKTPPGKQLSSLLHNGVPSKSSPPIQKPEKRTHNKMQQNDTVDLTDDEPPSKQLPRNVNKPVRFVPPQNFIGTPRQTFSSTVNSPRTVYIPISGSQTQGVRPGQTFMLKAISPQQGPRPRIGPALMSKQPPNARTTRTLSRHPAPLPESSKQYEPPNWKSLPPAPELKLSKVENGIVISWKIDGYVEDNYEEIASFQLYAYQETSSPPCTALWKKIGDVKALPLPMACTLTQFMAGYKYYFAVRAVDVKSRVGQFSEPGSILLLNKM